MYLPTLLLRAHTWTCYSTRGGGSFDGGEAHAFVLDVPILLLTLPPVTLLLLTAALTVLASSVSCIQAPAARQACTLLARCLLVLRRLLLRDSAPSWSKIRRFPTLPLDCIGLTGSWLGGVKSICTHDQDLCFVGSKLTPFPCSQRLKHQDLTDKTMIIHACLKCKRITGK